MEGVTLRDIAMMPQSGSVSCVAMARWRALMFRYELPGVQLLFDDLV